MAHLILVLGRRGVGKTTLALHLASQWPGPIYTHDPLAQAPDRWPEISPEGIIPGALWWIDEIDLLAHPAGYRDDLIREVVHYGRHYGVSIIGTSRRPASVHRDVTALASEIYLGRIIEPRDLDYCARAWGEIAYRARDLPLYQFLHFTP